MRKEGIPKSSRFDLEFRFCEPSPEAVVRICLFVFPTFYDFTFAFQYFKIDGYSYLSPFSHRRFWKVIDFIFT